MSDILRPELSGIQAFVFDLDGVLYEADVPIAGTVDTVARLKHAGIPVRFLTNTTSLSRHMVAAKLSALGFDADADEVYTPTRAAGEYLRQAGASAWLLVHEAALHDFDNVRRDEERPDAVVVGDLGPGWTFDKLNRAFRLVVERGAKLVGLGRTRYWRTPEGLTLDAGPFVAALEYATGTRAVVFGKPEPEIFRAVVNDLQRSPQKIAMLGDDIVTDVDAAMRAGLFGVLVKTGKFRQSDLEGGITPDLVLPSAPAVLATR